MSDLFALLEVQQHDTAADQLRHRRANLRERVAHNELRAALEALDAKIAASGAEEHRLNQVQSGLEREVVACEQKLADLDRKLRTSSVPREAEALQAERRSVRARQQGLEEELLTAMEALEPVEMELVELADQRDELDARLTVAAAELSAAEAVVDAELAAVVEQRTAAAAPVPAAMLARYERQRARLGGVAVAQLVGGRCSGCNLQLSTAAIEELRHLPPDALAECEQSGRLLVR